MHTSLMTNVYMQDKRYSFSNHCVFASLNATASHHHGNSQRMCAAHNVSMPREQGAHRSAFLKAYVDSDVTVAMFRSPCA